MKVYKFEAFTSAIEKNIREGIFKPGHKLPSVRELKAQYETSISTIQQGYDYLVATGLVESVPKSGYYVANRPDISRKKEKTNRKPIVRDAVFKHHLELITSMMAGRKYAEFNVAAPGDLLMPQKLILRTMQQVIREEGAGLLRYYPSNGSTKLKSQIIKKAAAYQTMLHPDELLITDGALQALYIALSAVCNAGDVIAVESPCVFSALEVIRVLQLRVIEIPVDPLTGFDIAFLKKACRHNTIKAIVVTPNFHNPTGILLTDEQKQDLLAVGHLHNIAIIENDIYGDLFFHGHRPTNIKSFDDSGLVLTYTSYAKTMAPGIRLGWLAAGKYTQRAEQIKFSLGSSVSPIYQEVMQRLLAGNSYDRHVRSFRMQLAKHAHFTIHLLSAHFPKNTMMLTPAGGYNIWVKMPESTDMADFYRQCEKIGVRFTPGYTFSFSGAFEKYFRIVFADKFTTKRVAAIRMAGKLAR
ncbi:PLP-dependent aminotransferase family protein [Chitinophaga sp. Hz27]|uniref:aminotransferase-like domain-containing protein n=1 Tax=Chitinophaga sp. Hz27 TaxID=3347169 RepID=UPI0035E0B334